MRLRFTYDAYLSLLRLLSAHGYICADYHDWKRYPRCVILRHDIDYDISHALEFAEREANVGWIGTYFVLVRSDLYNAFSRNNLELLKRILSLGHKIGLHFDEMAYPEAIGSVEKIRGLILAEISALSETLGETINCVSMHRPSKAILKADLDIPGIINSYGQTFFRDFKYLSDSRRHWREPVEEIVEGEQFEHLHILTHAFWYEEKETSLKISVQNSINRANYERYLAMHENFTDLDDVLSMEDVVGIKENGGESVKRITAKEICRFLDNEGIPYKLRGDENTVIDTFANLQELDDHTLFWIKNKSYINDSLMERLSSLHDVIVVAPFPIENVASIVTDYPKGVFFSILNHFFAEAFLHTISDQATVLTDAIGENVHIGPGCYVGPQVQIGSNTILHPNVVIDCPCTIGKNCEIFSGVVIGADGFGYYKDADGVPHREVHYKGVIIGDNVDIGSNACIDRGLLTDTVIGSNVKIGKLCGIGHNVRIDENCLITGQVLISGSAHICRDVYAAPGSLIKNQITVGEKATVGMGSVALRNVKPGSTVFGIPALKI